MKPSSGVMSDIKVSRTPDKRSLNSESATPGRAWVSNFIMDQIVTIEISDAIGS
jgi:hypothetical protein